ncbi:MAG: LysR family transcriptional regulator [Rhizobiales bacterium]|nr:LysR family transcriptional regulator [Hyphomicrobiales bacterium]
MPAGFRYPPLKWLMAFEAAARHMSFTAAAEELGLSQATVSYQIKCLEGMVGSQLFERKPRHLQLTDIGQAYLPAIRRTFDELFASTAGLFAQVGQNHITVRVAISFMVLCLGPRLSDFRARHPAIRINFWSSIWASSEDTSAADLDIRFGLGTWPGYEATLLANDSAILVCSPQMAESLRTIDDLALLPPDRMIDVAGQDDLWRRAMLKYAGIPTISSGPRVDTTLAAAELACSSVGVVLLSKLFARPYLNSGRLVAPLDLELELKRAHYLLQPAARKRPPAEVLLFRDWLLRTDWSG